MRSIILSAAAPFLIAACLALASADQTGRRPASPPVGDAPTDDLFRPPDAPLDPRIDADRITEHHTVPLRPPRLRMPLPVSHRIATESDQVPIDEDHWRAARAAIERGITYLRGAQDEFGGWMTHIRAAPTDQPEKPSPIAVAVTAMAVKAIVQAQPEAVDEPAIKHALHFIRLTRKPDGSFEGGALTNYVTSTVIGALAALDTAPARRQIQGGAKWLQSAQWDQAEGLNPHQDWFGGAGYGNRGRPDLSNTQMMLEALYDAGLSPDEPAFQKALAFLSRTQNLKATNSAAWAGNDGGFVYTCANGGESMASEYAGEGRRGEKRPPGAPRSLRSYGSMTYAGFKSLLYAGLTADDPRVAAALDWIRRHFTFDENPGIGQQGLYYYYHAMSRALRVAQQPELTDADGVKHNWREELIDALAARQRDDGSWINSADRWLETQPPLVTTYALLALQEALKPVH